MKNLIRFALQKPISIIVVVLAIGIFSYSAIKKINVDIFPKVELPSIYVAMPYGGLSPAYMDGFMANEFQKVLLFVSGVKAIDFKSVQGLTLMKLSFYPGTNMSQSAAEVATSVSRAMAFLPEGAVAPIVVRFDASALPVGKLVFESDQRSISEIQTLVISKIRPMFVQVPGITAPAPFGGSRRTIIVDIDPQALQANELSPEQITAAIVKNSRPAPAGNIRIGNIKYMTPVNSIARDPKTFGDIPVKNVENRTIYVKDVAHVHDGADELTGFALVNGKRSVFLPVIKKASSSTLEAVKNLRAALPMLENQLPEDVKMSYEFDQSKYIENAVDNLVHEGLLGALFTGLMILFFLGDIRGATIVVLTIPIAILSAVSVLYLFGQTINIMTLSGLALSIGILVDEATVTIENIHQHLEKGKPKRKAILDALFEISIPKLLILLCILAVLTPAFVMSGIPKDMFMPLSLAVAFAMIASFLASQTIVPILANWMMKHSHEEKKHSQNRKFFDKLRVKYAFNLRKWSVKTTFLASAYVLIAGSIVILLFSLIGTDIMPKSNSGDFQLRIVAPPGTRIEKTEKIVMSITEDIKRLLPEDGILITDAYVGMEPPNTPINQIFLFTSASNDAILQVSVNQSIYSESMMVLKEKIRQKIHTKHPNVVFNFEPMELTEKIMSRGAMTPIEVKVGSGKLATAENFAKKIQTELEKLDYLRDIRIAEHLHYPTLDINVNRDLLGQFGLTMSDVTKSLVTATSSSRYTNKNLWVDPKSGRVFQMQVQIPKHDMNSEAKLRALPLKAGSVRPVLEDVATITRTTTPAQVNRRGPNKYVTLIANIHNKDLGTATKGVDAAIQKVGKPPRGVTVWTGGTMDLLKNTLSGLQTGLLVSVIAIFLMLSAYYQSFKVPIAILTVLPAVIAGGFMALYLTGSTLNLQSYMGIIMSLGVSVSNAVLLIDQAEVFRKKWGFTPKNAGRLAASARFRPILMTTGAMIAGMIPMALGLGSGGEQIAPLGRAVIGGLLGSTITILFLLPHFFSSIMKKSKVKEVSLLPLEN